jgi:hypothetical protein
MQEERRERSASLESFEGPEKTILKTRSLVISGRYAPGEGFLSGWGRKRLNSFMPYIRLWDGRRFGI